MKKMKRKNMIGLIAIVAILAAVIFAGCVEEETPTQTQTILKPEVISVNSFYCTDVFEAPFLDIGRCNWFSPYEFFIFGLIENQGDLPVYDIKISYTLYDTDGMIVGSDTISMWTSGLDTIPPKQDIPFRITTSGITNITNYKFDIQYDTESYVFVPYRNFEQNNVNIKKAENKLIISGEIKNIGNEISKGTTVMAVLYDKDGKIIDVLSADTNPVEINLGETASFVIKESYSKNGLDKIDTYKLWIQGHDWKY
jgi:hypothetical protein